MWKGAALVAIVGAAAVYLAAWLIDPHERLDAVFPIVWVIGVTLVAIGHREATS
jgi:hypothetical protein